MERALLPLALIGCASPHIGDPEPGVAWRLAEHRARTISDVRYHLSFTIPESAQKPVRGLLTLTFVLSDASGMTVLDFDQPGERVLAVQVGGKPAIYTHRNGHLVVSDLGRGKHSVSVEFLAGDRSLNRNPDYVYTLLVPDRAATVFPCFDQPNLKARFQLELLLPPDWVAVSNLPLGEETPPIPTYLFAFAAGKFETVTSGSMRMFHRETDQEKVARNQEAIFELHARSLRWLEEYTGIPYPFDKFDFVLLPSFQYNGMEHPGAIFYRAAALLLEETATQEQKLERANVIAHETSHMWFGDLVTMTWFDDVWMKEVFANFLAAKIVNPSFPEIDHELRFLMAHYPAAYAVDRTDGTHPIRQELANLKEAGTLYGAIIYKKAPIVMRLVERMTGEAAFRDGVREYLRTFAWRNASWRDLIAILGRCTRQDLESWSRAWIEESGRPTLTVSGREVVQTGPQQKFDVLDASGVTLPYAYGLVRLEEGARARLVERLPTLPSPLVRGVAWITLWEEMLENRGTPEAFFDLTLRGLESETDELNVQRIVAYLRTLYWRFLRERPSAKVEELLWRLMERAPSASLKSTYFRTFRSVAITPDGVARLRKVWNRGLAVDGLKFSEVDFIDMALELAVRGETVLETQLARIENPDRRARFAFVMPALSADPAARDAFFESLKDAKNRTHEPWVIEGLAYLNHPLRADEKRIQPGLELLEEIQRTGDIFFPERWVDALLGGHRSNRAAAIARDFLAERPDYPPRLRQKILQSADGLFRAARIAGKE